MVRRFKKPSQPEYPDNFPEIIDFIHSRLTGDELAVLQLRLPPIDYIS